MWKPIGERVLVRLDIQEKTTASGIVLPEAVDEKWRMGVVLGIGERVKEDLAVGDRVLMSSYAGSTVPEMDDVRIVGEAELWGVRNDEAGA